ncbi:MAG: hypothetical protein RLZZ241_2415 [Bacteroidota bacterium]|jgi:predicted dehydrogenase
MIKAGVLGAGHLGKIHIRLLQQSKHYDLIGFYDPDASTGNQVSKTLGVPYFNSVEALISEVDLIDIVTPTLSHFDCAKKAITAGKHVFIEKPITHSYQEALELIDLCERHGVKGQVGHVERFNPAFTAVKSQLESPMFIESHRLAEFNPRGTDVPVVLDLMIHDIDIILSVVQSKVRDIQASGVSVISKSPDITNARIAFENGCVANLTASRISMKNMRKSRFFQKDAYISVDFLERKAEVVRMKDAPTTPGPFDMILKNAEGQEKQIYFQNPEIQPNNAILDELEQMADAIALNRNTPVPLDQGAQALKVALDIIAACERNLPPQSL